MARTLRVKLILLTLLVVVFDRSLFTALRLHFSGKEVETWAREDATLFSQEVALHARTLLRAAGREVLAEEIKAVDREFPYVASIEIFFFDGARVEVVSSRPQLFAVPPAIQQQQAVQQGRTLTSLITRGDEQFFHVLTPLRENDMVVGAVRVWISVADIQKLKAEEQRRAILFAVASMVGVVLLLGFFLHRQVSRPLRQITAAMQAAEAGDLEAQVDLKRQDELGQLGTHFNRMLARIAKTDAENRRLIARTRHFNEELEVRVASVTRDLSEKNEQLFHLQQEVARVGPLAALGQVVGTIAHELGTPLNSVLGYSQMLAQEGLSDRARRYATIIETQAQRMVDIFQHYHSHTRGYLSKHHHIDLNELVRETLVLLAPLFQRHQVRITATLTESLPLLTADGSSLQRMLINLLNNAVDALEGGGMVAVTTRTPAPAETSRHGVVLEVTDTGSGIPPELLPKVFALFFTTKAPSKGAGLGLAICEEIVNQHGGTIRVTSQVGVGTCVRVFLPTEDERVVHPQPAAEEA